MTDDDARVLRDLLRGTRLLALGVLVDGRPYVGQVPFAHDPATSSLLVHVSRLARHSRGLGEGAPWSGLITAGESGGDPFRVARVSLEGTVRRPAGTEAEAAKERYLEALPSAERHFLLGDFFLVRLEVAGGRLVAGFGRAATVSPAVLGSA